MAYQTPRLRPLGVGDLLDELIRLYRTHFKLLAGISAVVLAPLYLINSLVDIVWGPASLLEAEPSAMADTMSLMSLLIWGLFSLVWGLVFSLGSLAVALATTRAASEVYLGGTISIRDAYSAAIHRLAAAVGLAIVMGIAVGLMAITVIGIPAAIYFGICWVLAFQALLLEQRGIRESLSRSRALVRGYWWRVLGIAILLAILSWILGFVISLPAGILAAVGTFMDAGFASSLIRLVGSLLSIVAIVLVTPIWYSGAVLVYYDLRVRKEGLDIELMAGEMETMPGVSPDPL